jgi:hypothetical protein
MLKFPPGFFGDDQLRLQDGRISRKRSNDSSKIHNEDIYDNGFTGGSLPRILEMPKVDNFEENIIKEKSDFNTFKSNFNSK